MGLPFVFHSHSTSFHHQHYQSRQVSSGLARYVRPRWVRWWEMAHLGTVLVDVSGQRLDQCEDTLSTHPGPRRFTALLWNCLMSTPQPPPPLPLFLSLFTLQPACLLACLQTFRSWPTDCLGGVLCATGPAQHSADGCHLYKCRDTAVIHNCYCICFTSIDWCL